MALTVILIISLCAFASSKRAKFGPMSWKASNEHVCYTETCQQTAEWLLAAMNQSVDPCENFYQFACGGWIEKHLIPPSKSRYISFDVVREELSNQLNDVLLSPKVKLSKSKSVLNAQKLFQGCLDLGSREREGIQPVKNLLKELGGWPILNLRSWDGDDYNWAEYAAKAIKKLYLGTVINLMIITDERNTDYHIIQLDQPYFQLGRNQLLNLTENDYTKALVAAYKQFMIRTAQLLGSASSEDDIKQAVDDIVDFESDLAKLTSSPEDRRDPNRLYNKMTISQLQQLTQDSSSFDWKTFLNTILAGFTPVEDSTEIIVREVDYLKGMLQLMTRTSTKTIANYIGWKIMFNVAPSSTSAFRETKFQFEKVQYGVEEQQEMFKLCTDDVIEMLGFAVGRLYIENYFSEDAKADVEYMVENLRSAYLQTLSDITWMDDNTKQSAIEKLEAMISMMAYPQWIMDDDKLDEYYLNVPNLNSETFFASSVNAASALIAKRLKRWNEKINRTEEWIVAPAVVNAFYNPKANTIVFPAGILNMPFYKYNRLHSMNYGGIGAVIGHEMSHGFDDQGSQYDKDGNLNNWWTTETRKEFVERAQCFMEQYSQFVEPSTGIRLNGRNTVGENISDNGAVRNAYMAYSLFLKKKKGRFYPGRLPGLNATADQLFFLGYASAWCGSERKESLRLSIQYDTHSPAEYRVLVPLMNSDDFAKAFNCPVGSNMNPTRKCVLW